MHLIYDSYATPVSAFFEGMVRVFDWGALLLALRRKQRQFSFNADDPERSQRVVDSYIRDAIATFEVEESEKLSEIPFVSRRGCPAADITLGPLPNEDVIITYEEIVPGAVSRIMGRASDRLKGDSQAELEHFKGLCQKGHRGMIVGFILTLLLSASALLLIFAGALFPGLVLVGINIATGVLSTVYVSKAGLRGRWFTGEFFPSMSPVRSRYRVNQTGRFRRSAA